MLSWLHSEGGRQQGKQTVSHKHDSTLVPCVVCVKRQEGSAVTWDSCSIGRIWAWTVWTLVLVYKGRSSFCEASHDFELKTLSFIFLRAEVSLGSFAFEVD